VRLRGSLRITTHRILNDVRDCRQSQARATTHSGSGSGSDHKTSALPKDGSRSAPGIVMYESDMHLQNVICTWIFVCVRALLLA
jgi:hypothetical protein